MNKYLINLLRCPGCGLELALLKKDDKEEIVSGFLTCPNQHHFSIKNGIPLLRKNLILKTAEPLNARYQEDFNFLGASQKQHRLRQMIESLIDFSKAKSKQAQKNLQRNIKFNLQFSRKDKYVKLMQPYFKFKPKRILEMGLGQGGFSASLKDLLNPELQVGLDFDEEWARLAKMKNPWLNIIVADAANLPFQDNSFDLVVSAYLLEHVKNWQKVIDETKRAAPQSFFIFGPNKYFPWDYGHFRNSPLLTYLPPRYGKYLAYGVAKWRGFADTLSDCAKELSTMNYLSPLTFEKYLVAKDLRFHDLFNSFIKITLSESYQYWRLNYLLKKIKGPASLLFRLLHFLKLHPFLVYFLQRKD